MKRIVLAFLCCLAFAATSHAQCSETIFINTGQMNGGQQQVYQFQLDDIANVEDIMLTMNWGTNGGISWPADLVLGIDSPEGGCVSFYDYDNQNIAGCISEGPAFPPSWNGVANGVYSFSASINAGTGVDQVFANVLSGTGIWTFTVINTWDPDYWASYNMTLTLSGACAAECNDPVACNYVPDTEYPDNDVCEYAEDLFGPNLDCNGNCINDEDGDLICDEDEVPGCQELWACNYNAAATDPASPTDPCTYPETDEVDCEGNSLLPQFLIQPQDATVPCNGVPEVAEVNVQVAPAAINYFNLLPESCYDDDIEVPITFTESVIPGNCPGNYTIQRFWEIVDCNGFQNSHLQTIQVVDNLPPVVTTDLEPITLNCNDPVVFPSLQFSDECEGEVSVVGQPTFVSLPGGCSAESTEKKYTVISDQCGNETTVEQTLVFADDVPPYWLNEPNEIIITDNIDDGVFDVPVADDICSAWDVTVATTSGPGDCPLSTVLTRTFVAVDACGNSSLPFVQTIKEVSDLMLTGTTSTDVTCNGGADGTAALSYEGGVAPYEENWFGYDPNALPGGVYNVQVTDDNLCVIETAIVVAEPPPFSIALDATSPACNNPTSGVISVEVFGGTGTVSIDWDGLNPNAVSAGEYTAQAMDESGCTASASVVVPPADIPESLGLAGDTFVAQGDSAAYYYEYTIGSTYEWSFTGATEEVVSNIFAISLLWDSLGTHDVCVVETNQEGCSGEPVCLTVMVEDDVWNIQERQAPQTISIHPNPASVLVNMTIPAEMTDATYTIFNGIGAVVTRGDVQNKELVLNVSEWPSGPYVVALDRGNRIRFHVTH